MPDQTLETKFVVDAQSALIEAGKFNTLVAQIKQQLIQLNAQSGMTFKSLAVGMKAAFAQQATAAMNPVAVKQYNAAMTQALQQVTQSAPKATAAIQGTTKALTQSATVASKLGSIFKNAFSFFLGGSIFAMVMRLINGFQELIRVGEEYSMVIYRLGVSINQLQRRGMDITIASEVELIKELSKQYTTFSTKGVIGAVAAVQMLTRNFGFNQEQIRKTIELSMDLALVQGKDVAETAKQLALFYSSGYGEGLQHAGLAVNRMTVLNEAHRMGLKKSYMQLTEVERATAAYNLVTRQSADLHEDAVKIQESLIGKIKEQRSSIENVTNEIALKALPVELAWLKIKLALFEATNKLIRQGELSKEYREANNLNRLQFNRPEGEQEFIDKQLKDEHDQWEKMLSETLNVNPDLNLDLGDDQAAADAVAKLGDLITEAWNDLQAAQADHNLKEQELAQENADKLVDIANDAADERVQAYADYAKDVENIEKDLAQTIADYQLDASRDAVDLDRDYQLAQQDANRKYHEEEIKAERDYQERMRRLREEFLFDLEDALRERDALQVLRLIRRYKLDVEQEKRAGEEAAKERRDNYQQELDDLRRKHEEQERQNQISLQRQIDDAKAASEQKLQDAKDAWIAKSDAIDAKEQENLEKEKSAYIVRQLELDKDLKERQDKILAAFGVEIGTTGTSLDQVAQLFTAYLGSQGVVASVIDEYVAKISEAAIKTDENVQKMIASIQALQAIAAGTGLDLNSFLQGQSAPDISKFASGGSMVATKPTMAIFGEAGPELATFTPLSKMNSNGSGEGGGRGTLEISLAPGLIGEIVDNALGEVAVVMRRK